MERLSQLFINYDTTLHLPGLRFSLLSISQLILFLSKYPPFLVSSSSIRSSLRQRIIDAKLVPTSTPPPTFSTTIHFPTATATARV
ncbi:hypothetical protein NXS19_007420 [Fusarium pseudograminearum]|nr:hypothetical protein NXS19_007420 [Fusarium pseudograminearum]